MNRQNVLLRLHHNLLARKADLGKKLAGELAYLHDCKFTTGDSADWAFEGGSDEITSQLAELDARQLNQTEWALARVQQGTYGICEGGSPHCQKRIPLARLNALPDTTLCINCERDREQHPARLDRPKRCSWGLVVDAQAPMQDPRVNPTVFALSQSGNRSG